MGNWFSGFNKILDIEKTSWTRNHNLEYNPQLREEQLELIEKFKKTLKICYKESSAYGLEYCHWYITDDHWVIEFGTGDFTNNTVLVHNNPKATPYVVDDVFQMSPDVKKRIRLVCGATNYSLALRNCEHLSRYVL